MYYCTNCGQRLVDDANFCGYCGQRIIQPDSASVSEPVKDLVADKAEDVVIQDDNLLSCENLKNDDVAQNASYIGEISLISRSSVQRKIEPQYVETRNAFSIDDLFIIQRENASTHRVSCCLLNTISNSRSEWFDCIEYCGYNISYIEKDGLKGLIEESLNYQLWDQMASPADTYLGTYYYVRKNGKWAVITIRHKKIEQVTAYEYDNISPFVECAAIVKQNKKYGYLLYDKDPKEMRMLPCVLDGAHEFVVKNTKCYATVVYQGSFYEMDKKGILCNVSS